MNRGMYDAEGKAQSLYLVRTNPYSLREQTARTLLVTKDQDGRFNSAKAKRVLHGRNGLKISEIT